MRIVHFCAGLEEWNGMANTARQFVTEELANGDDSRLTNNIDDVVVGVDKVVIHGAWLPILWKVAKLAKAVGAKLVIRPAGSYDPVRLAYHAWKKRLVAPFERRMLRRADVLLATCDAEADWIKSYEPKVKSIELTDLKRFFNLANAAEKTGQAYSPRTRPLHFLYLGRQHPLKGLSYLQEAWNTYYNICSKSHSSGNTQNTYYNMCSAELCIVSNAFGDELEKVWNWCDVLILPTLSENFGRVIAEALERGKRVITTDGAPAWSPSASAAEDKGDGNDYGGRLVYLRGYRDGSPEDRIRLLVEAITSLANA